MNKQIYYLYWGYHNGDLLSRQHGEPIVIRKDSDFTDCIGECQKNLIEVKSHLNFLGLKLWYAKIQFPDGTQKTIDKGTPYKYYNDKGEIVKSWD